MTSIPPAGTPGDDALPNVVDEEHRIRTAYARRSGADRYSPLRPGQLFMLQEMERMMVGALRAHGERPIEECRALDVGCGAGYWLRAMTGWGARPEHLSGVDLLHSRLVAARANTPSAVGLVCGSATSLPFPDAHFDLILQCTVFSSILDPRVRAAVAAEMLRVVRPSGMVLWYDMRVRNPGNRDVRGISAKEIRRLFPGATVRAQSATLAPPLVRAIAPYSWLLCSLLSGLPFARTHMFAVIRPLSS